MTGDLLRDPAPVVIDRDEVVLVLPIAPEYLRLARMTAAGLASRMGFTYDDVADLRIAVDELCFALCGTEGRSGSLLLTYCVSDDGSLGIEGMARLIQGQSVTAPSELSEQILAAVVDEHILVLDDEVPRFGLRKRPSTAGKA